MPNIQHGATEKLVYELVIPFNPPFQTTPTVVISPYYRPAAVGEKDVVTEITPAFFTVIGRNQTTAAGPYYVSWTAIEG